MRFTVHFHGPFRVAAGASSDGLDATFDAANPLPSSSLKGVMRASAERTLGVGPAMVDEIFGSAATASPWWWSDAVIEPDPADHAASGRVRTQLQINPLTHTALDRTLRTCGEMWPSQAQFEVRRRGHVSSERVTIHEAVLQASARAITALGSGRRRGLGWVSVMPEEPWTDDKHQALLSCRSSNA